MLILSFKSMHVVNSLTCLFVTTLFGQFAANKDSPLTVSLNIKNANSGQTIPPTMHGVIFETNINRGDDGGLYAELIYNRAFQG